MKQVTVNNETYNSPEQNYYWLDADTYFDIQDNIDLGGDTLYGVKESSIFAFHGGTFSNGTIYGILHVEAGAYQIFQNNVDLTNSELKIKVPYILPEWFGAGTGADDYAALKLAFDIAARSSQIVRLSGQYSLGNNTQPLVVDKNCTLLFAGGSLRNGILGGYINLKTESNDIFGDNLTFAEGTELNVPYLRPEWFGAKGDAKLNVRKTSNEKYPNESEYYYTGTDDTEAINRTVRTAERLSIKTVKFNAANYLVSGEGIIIARGNVILEGSGALLREDQGYNYTLRLKTTNEITEQNLGFIDGFDKYAFDTSSNQEIDDDLDFPPTSSRTSSICCNNGGRCITCYAGKELKVISDTGNTTDKYVLTGVADPIYIKDLQFMSGYIVDGPSQEVLDETKPYLFGGKESIAIDFQAKYSGPTWPVIIERCYFKRFAVAFFLNSELNYCIHCLTFRDNAFSLNNWCVYAKENGYVTKNPDNVINLYEGPWSFEFVDNRCHHNNFLIRICVHKGFCLIENNNTEGTYGFTNKNDDDTMEDTPDEYAIDVQLDQRAVARICHNHFESNRTRLVKVVGCSANDSRAFVTETNTDGTYETLNKCYFKNVILETDQNAIIRNCVIENKLPCEKTLTLEAIKENTTIKDENNNTSSFIFHHFNHAFLRHRGNKLIKNVPFRLVDRTAHGGTVMWVTTPYGQHWMTCLYKTSVSDKQNGDIVLDADIYTNQESDLVANNRYLNIEIPFYKEDKSGQLNYLRVTLSDPTKKDQILSIEEIQKYECYENKYTSIGSNQSGFYWIRMQMYLDQELFSALHLQAHAFPAGHEDMSYDAHIFYGAATYVLSSEPLDLNIPLNPHDFDLEPLKTNLGACLFKKGNRFVTGVYDVTCLQEGLLTNEEAKKQDTFYHYYEDGVLQRDIVICRPKLPGTWWLSNERTFKILSLVSVDKVDQNGIAGSDDMDTFDYLKYYIEELGDSTLTELTGASETGQCITPILKGNGIGTTKQRNQTLVQYLSTGSTYYDTTSNKSYILGADHQWIES